MHYIIEWLYKMMKYYVTHYSNNVIALYNELYNILLRRYRDIYRGYVQFWGGITQRVIATLSFILMSEIYIVNGISDDITKRVIETLSFILISEIYNVKTVSQQIYIANLSSLNWYQ